MPSLKVTRRPDTGALTITGTVAGRRIRTRAQSDSRRLAEEEAADLEARLLREHWHGERRGARGLTEAVESYLDAAPRSLNTKHRAARILLALGEVPLAAIDQNTVDLLRRMLLRANPAPATLAREVITPLTAILAHAARRGWCDVPAFERPRPAEGRTLYLLPEEARRLMAAAAPHLQPLILFILGTGARMAEAIELDWRDLDLAAARAIFWDTKSGRRRLAQLPASVVAALAALPEREGAVFRWQHRRRGPQDYADRARRAGGHIKTGWKGAIRRAGLDARLTPHDLRHTWASWHYAVHKDLLLLKRDGAWRSVTLVERYAHLLPAGCERAILAFWHGAATDTEQSVLTA